MERKTRHDYENFDKDIQEKYLCIKYQLGYHQAGRWLKKQFCFMDFVPLIYTVAVASMGMGIAFESLKKAGLIKRRYTRKRK